MEKLRPIARSRGLFAGRMARVIQSHDGLALDPVRGGEDDFRRAGGEGLPKIKNGFTRDQQLALLGAAVVFIVIATMGELLQNYRETDKKEARFLDSLTFIGKLRAQVESELNSVLYLSSGLGSYLVVRNNQLQAKEVNDILAVLHQSSGYVRDFGIAVGYTLKYVYPRAGNEAAIGLHYPDLPQQWPMVKRVAERGMPALDGPLDLVQGGRGLIYRVPLYLDRHYWGMLSTVIDLDSFASVIAARVDLSQFEYAIRASAGSTENGDVVLGDKALFDRADALTQAIDVPGGSWLIAVRPLRDPGSGHADAWARSLFYPLALIAAWMMYLLIRSRSALATLALYDPLTGLPNRHLLEDRAEMAFARQRRNPGQTCAILFLDLDGFKGINDRCGHKAGDAVLLAVAERARAVVRENDTVARWGGDEFIVLMDDVDPSTVQRLTERLRSEIEAPIPFEGATLRVGVSIGMALCPKFGGSLDTLLKLADQQMYAEKQQRKAA